MDKLFYDSNNNLYTAEDIRKVLKEIGASDYETLFIHSDVMFGKPAEGFKRTAYLSTLFNVVNSLGVKNIIVPTFTYSFCNKEDYDVLKSKTSMGSFNEFVRKQEGRFRTEDPLLSVSVPESLKKLFDHVSNHSLGEGCALDIIHKMDNVGFLFLGAEMGECFTYVHYVEKMMEVPYRFDMKFEGNIIFTDGTVQKREQFIHTQCYGAKLPQKYDYFEKEMEDRKILRKRYIAEKYIACISEKDAYREIKSHIENNISYFLAEPYRESNMIHKYTYDIANGRITHC